MTSVDAACARDPLFCAELVGDMARSAGAMSGNACLADRADNVADGITNIATLMGVGSLAKGAAKGARGLSSHGGAFSSSINAAGGEVWTATGKIAQKDFATYVNSGLYKGNFDIISGVHGARSGGTVADLSLFSADVARFGSIPGVRVHDFTTMTPK